MTHQKTDTAGPLIGWSIGTGVDDKSLQDLLDLPCMYTFKAIGEATDNFQRNLVGEVEAKIGRTLNANEFSVRESAEGKYVSLTFHLFVTSIEQIYEIYAVFRANPLIRFML